MIDRYIRQYLSEAISAIKDSLLPLNKVIINPNEYISSEVDEQDVYFEVYCGGVAPQYDTENSTKTSVIGTIVINGKINVGSSLIDAISETLFYNFIPTNPLRKQGFKVRNFYDSNIVNVYISNIERTETGIDNGRYKTTLFITFDIYEG